MNNIKVQKLQCSYQNYAWGKIGPSSRVFELLVPSHAENPDQSLPYAELWLGTHPNGPSSLVSADKTVSLKEEISSNPVAYLGKKISKKFGNDLPFLFKVLSVRTALSIQAHPNKEFGAKLHESRPDIYKDPNHKPEMAIALTRFEALLGFRPMEEIANFLKIVPEFRSLVGEEVAKKFEKNVESGTFNIYPLKLLFKTLMTSNEDKVKEELSLLVNRLSISNNEDAVLGELIIRLNSQYPGDIGVFCVFLLNHVTLLPGEAIFLSANEPHAYLSGDCIECMATSDNVVRAGLTPKFKDVDVLIDMLTYETCNKEEKKMAGIKMSSRKNTFFYFPPVSEFSVSSVVLAEGSSTEEIYPEDGPGILLITEAPEDSFLTIHGESVTFPLAKGSSFFIPPNTTMSLIKGKGDPSAKLTSFFAYCSV